jgi:small subunit ribosomal protein S21
MTQVNARPGEDIDSLLKRFKRATEQAGILADWRKNEAYEKPSVRKRKKSIVARKRLAKHPKREKPKNFDFTFNKDKTRKIPMKPRRPFNRTRRKSNERINR